MRRTILLIDSPLHRVTSSRYQPYRKQLMQAGLRPLVARIDSDLLWFATSKREEQFERVMFMATELGVNLSIDTSDAGNNALYQATRKHIEAEAGFDLGMVILILYPSDVPFSPVLPLDLALEATFDVARPNIVAMQYTRRRDLLPR